MAPGSGDVPPISGLSGRAKVASAVWRAPGGLGMRRLAARGEPQLGRQRIGRRAVAACRVAGAVLLGTASLGVATVGRHRAVAAPAPRPAAVAEQPPPTSSPQAPAVMIAGADGVDLTGEWLVDRGGLYYLFVSTAFGDGRHNVPLVVGRPGRWSAPVDALPVLPAWATPVADGGTTWQPEVKRLGRHWVLYFSGLVRGSQPPEHCIGTAVSSTVAGPYRPSPFPIVCQRDEGGDIDAQVVADPASPGPQLYLVWKSDNNVLPTGGSDLIWSQPLASDGLSLTGTPAVIFGSQAAPSWAQPIVEAPQLVRSPLGGWWLFYSGGGGFLSR